MNIVHETTPANIESPRPGDALSKLPAILQALEQAGDNEKTLHALTTMAASYVESCKANDTLQEKLARSLRLLAIEREKNHELQRRIILIMGDNDDGEDTL